MRNFFKDKLNNLYIYCGNRQCDKMSDEEITTLLNALERVSKLYAYIPEEHQKQIIEKCLIEDKEYQNLNARLISKWFEVNGKKFFTQECHTPTEHNAIPLTGEAREQWLRKWEETLANAEQMLTNPAIKGSGQRIRENLEANNFVIPESESALNEHCEKQAEEILKPKQ